MSETERSGSASATAGTAAGCLTASGSRKLARHPGSFPWVSECWAEGRACCQAGSGWGVCKPVPCVENPDALPSSAAPLCSLVAEAWRR